MSANFHTLPLTEGKPIEKASIWEPERSMFKIMRRKTILSLYTDVYFCSFEAYHPRNLNLAIRTNE